MFTFNIQQQELAARIDCSRCADSRSCDQIRRECPKVNFHTLQVDDVSILKPETHYVENEGESLPAGFTKTTRRDFETHQYGNISRCKYRNKILSFFSSEKEIQGLFLFFFSHQGQYYSAFRDKRLPDDTLEKQIQSFLHPENKSFVYDGWLCRFDANDMLFHLYTPGEMEQPAGLRISEMEVFTPSQAIEFINCY